MTSRGLSVLLAAGLLAACDPSALPEGPVTEDPATDVSQPRGIVGEWRLEGSDSLSWCRFVVDPGDGGGRATDFGCIDLDGFAGFIRRWEREDGRILFFSLTRDGPVAIVRQVDRNTFRGRLIPSGREIEMTRR